MDNRTPISSIRVFILSIIFFSIGVVNAPFVEAGTSPVLNIFLVQNSGWMEPFYSDGNSKFKSLVETVVKKVTHEGDEIVIAGFNQSIGDNLSPKLVYRGNLLSEANKAIEGIQPARKPGDKAFADTDFKEAVVGAITEYSPGRACILWIFTNNKNSPNNSPETVAKNKEFYSWLQNEDNIKRIIAYPYSMPVKGQYYEANGLMMYAMAYGKSANDMLEKLIAAKIPFDDKPARLKPLNAEAITFVPTGAANQGNIKASLAADGKTLVLQFDSSSKPEVAVINGVFLNDFYPYDIVSADVSLNVKFYTESHGMQSLIEPRTLTSVSAGKQSDPISVKIGIPPLPGIWSHPEIIFKNGYQTQAIMEFKLDNQQLQLSQDFIKLMNGLFPGDPLPEIFVPGNSAKQSTTVKPLIAEVAYPTWPLFVLMVLSLIIIFGFIWLIAVSTKAKKFTIIIDGMQKSYSLKTFGECALYTDRGDRIGTLRRRFGKPLAHLDNGRKEQVKIL
jgi:hypothetical protein